MPCDSEGFYFYEGWYVNSKALCEREVEGKTIKNPKGEEKDFGSDGCLPGLFHLIHIEFFINIFKDLKKLEQAAICLRTYLQLTEKQRVSVLRKGVI